MSFWEFKNNIAKHTTVALWVSFTVTVGLGIYSAICPPEGVIDKSVLEFGALLGGFATLAIAREAIREGLGVKYTHGNVHIEVDTDNDNDNVQEFHTGGADGFGHGTEAGN